jgi:hypothetical protein
MAHVPLHRVQRARCSDSNVSWIRCLSQIVCLSEQLSLETKAAAKVSEDSVQETLHCAEIQIRSRIKINARTTPNAGWSVSGSVSRKVWGAMSVVKLARGATGSMQAKEKECNSSSREICSEAKMRHHLRSKGPDRWKRCFVQARLQGTLNHFRHRGHDDLIDYIS